MKVLVYQFHVEYSKEKEAFKHVAYDNPRDSFGKFWEMSSITCKAYADKYGFDYLFHNPNENDYIPFLFNSPNFDQFKAIEFLKDYDAVLYVDSDILITSDAENIVKKYNTGFSNVVVNSAYGDKAVYRDTHAFKRLKGVNTGVVLWYNNSIALNGLYDFTLSSIEDNITLSQWTLDNVDLNKKWWETLEIFKPFLSKFKTGYYEDDKFLDFITHLYDIPRDHLDRIYNYTFPKNKNLNLFKNDAPQFIHFIGERKMYMKEYFDLIENMT
jgi:lipopolysaccharide biosynthesis glycosyltransferase